MISNHSSLFRLTSLLLFFLLFFNDNFIQLTSGCSLKKPGKCFKKAGDYIKKTVGGKIGDVRNQLNGVKKDFNNIKNKLGSLDNVAINAFNDVKKLATSTAPSVKNQISSVWSKVASGQAAKGLAGVVDEIEDFGDDLKDAWDEFINFVEMVKDLITLDIDLPSNSDAQEIAGVLDQCLEDLMDQTPITGILLDVVDGIDIILGGVDTVGTGVKIITSIAALDVGNILKFVCENINDDSWTEVEQTDKLDEVEWDDYELGSLEDSSKTGSRRRGLYDKYTSMSEKKRLLMEEFGRLRKDIDIIEIEQGDYALMEGFPPEGEILDMDFYERINYNNEPKGRQLLVVADDDTNLESYEEPDYTSPGNVRRQLAPNSLPDANWTYTDGYYVGLRKRIIFGIQMTRNVVKNGGNLFNGCIEWAIGWQCLSGTVFGLFDIGFALFEIPIFNRIADFEEAHDGIIIGDQMTNVEDNMIIHADNQFRLRNIINDVRDESLSDLESEISTLDTGIQDTDDKMDSLQTKIQSLESKVSSLSTGVADLTTSIDALIDSFTTN